MEVAMEVPQVVDIIGGLVAELADMLAAVATESLEHLVAAAPVILERGEAEVLAARGLLLYLVAVLVASMFRQGAVAGLEFSGRDQTVPAGLHIRLEAEAGLAGLTAAAEVHVPPRASPVALEVLMAEAAALLPGPIMWAAEAA
jgi:hypothetical protein